MLAGEPPAARSQGSAPFSSFIDPTASTWSCARLSDEASPGSRPRQFGRHVSVSLDVSRLPEALRALERGEHLGNIVLHA
jgi:hypothetical protein